MALRVSSSLFRHVNLCGNFPTTVRLLSTNLPNLEFVKVEKRGVDNKVGLVTLNRPKSLNALCGPLMNDLLVKKPALR
jgi:enoyl-CoA hydratase